MRPAGPASGQLLRVYDRLLSAAGPELFRACWPGLASPYAAAGAVAAWQSGCQALCLQLEDAYAACLFNNWQFSLLLDDCKNTQLWTCADCAAAYRAWLCASVFARCSGSPEQRVPTCRNTCFVSPTTPCSAHHSVALGKECFTVCSRPLHRMCQTQICIVDSWQGYMLSWCLAGGGAQMPGHQSIHLPSQRHQGLP